MASILYASSLTFDFLKDFKESNLFTWSGNKNEKDSENESRNDVNRVGKVCQILELELAFVAS